MVRRNCASQIIPAIRYAGYGRAPPFLIPYTQFLISMIKLSVSALIFIPALMVIATVYYIWYYFTLYILETS